MKLLELKKTTSINKNKSVEDIMTECEEYRETLVNHCLKYFECEYEYAEDCVQDAFVALYENLINGVEIKNYKSWLYSVTLNYKNKVVKDKIKRNEYEFQETEEKENTINSSVIYEPDYVNEMVTDKMIEERALHIISSLTKEEKELYISYYWKHKKLKEIATELNVSYATVRKRHEKLKKKLNQKIKEYENF